MLTRLVCVNVNSLQQTPSQRSFVSRRAERAQNLVSDFSFFQHCHINRGQHPLRHSYCDIRHRYIWGQLFMANKRNASESGATAHLLLCQVVLAILTSLLVSFSRSAPDKRREAIFFVRVSRKRAPDRNPESP